MKTCMLCERKLHLIKYRLKKGDFICSKCFKELPIDLLDSALNDYGKDDFKILKGCIEKTQTEYEKIFVATHILKDIALDSEHRLFKLTSPDIIYRIEDLELCEFFFESITKYKDMLSFRFKLCSVKPKFHLEYTLYDNIKVNAISDNDIGNDFTEYLPEEYREFMNAFYNCFKESKLDVLEKKIISNKRPVRTALTNDELTTADIDDITAAINLFGLDSLEGITEKELKRIKTNLLTCSRVMSIEYITKLNKSYELLSSLLKQI